MNYKNRADTGMGNLGEKRGPIERNCLNGETVILKMYHRSEVIYEKRMVWWFFMPPHPRIMEYLKTDYRINIHSRQDIDSVSLGYSVGSDRRRTSQYDFVRY